MEEADNLLDHQDEKSIYAKFKGKIERVIADAKEKHGMRETAEIMAVFFYGSLKIKQKSLQLFMI